MKKITILFFPFFSVLLFAAFFLIGCKKENKNEERVTEDAVRIMAINDFGTLTYKENKLVSFQHTPYTYSNDTVFIFYDNSGKMTSAVRKQYSYPDYKYTLMFFLYQGNKITQITSIKKNTNNFIEASTIKTTTVGFDTTSTVCARRYIEYDLKGRISTVIYTNGGILNGMDSLKYLPSSDNLSGVFQYGVNSARDTLIMTQYDTAANPVHKYLPQLPYVVMPFSGSDYDRMSCPLEVYGPSVYLGFCPNFIKKMKIWILYPYSIRYEEVTMNTTYDSRGNIYGSGASINMVTEGIAYRYSYN